MIETKILPVGLLLTNKGQLTDVPENPRNIRKDRLEALQRSIVQHPDMLHLRELIVVPYKAKYVIIAGNMRFEAAKVLGYTEMPCKILPQDTPAEDIRAYAIKDNISFGQDDHDLLSTQWNELELVEWGMELPVVEEEEVETTGTDVSDISTKLVVEAGDVTKLRDLYIELQKREFVCTLK